MARVSGKRKIFESIAEEQLVRRVGSACHPLRMARFLLVVLFGCSRSFVASTDGGVDALAVDAAFAGDAALDAPFVVSEDAGSTPTRCGLVLGSTVGEGCFCRGPVVVHGDHVYLQSQGIEVFERRGTTLTEVFQVDERPSARGGLVRVGEHLVSAVDFEEPPLRVYSLDDPARPRLVAGFGAASHQHLVAHGARVLVTRAVGEEAWLVLYDLSRPTRPELVFERRLADAPLAIALDDARVFVLEALRDAEGHRTRSVLRVLDHAGTEQASRELEGAAFDAGLASRAPFVYVSGGASRLTRLVADDLSLDRSVGEPSGIGGPIVFRDGLVVLGSSPFAVYEESSLRPIATDDSISGWSHLTLDGALLFGSSGGGVQVLSLSCE